MAPKRSSSGKSPMKKKARTDPVAAKVRAVISYLQDEQNCDVEGADTSREMLVAAVPHALGAAVDERYKYQTSVASWIGEVLRASVAKWQGKVNGAQAGIDEADAGKAEAENVLANAEGDLEASKAKVAEAKEHLQADKGADKEAGKGLAQANEDVAAHDGIQRKKEKEHDHCQSVCDGFATLRTGEWASPKEQKKLESSHLSAAMALLKKIEGVDTSLFGALPVALKKSPGDRGAFDEMAVTNAGGHLQSQLDKLGGEVRNGEAVKADKVASAQAAESALATAKENRSASIDALKAAEDAQKACERHVKDSHKGVDSAAGAISKAQAFHAVEGTGLAQADAALEAFTFLKDRRTPQEDGEEAAPEEAKSPGGSGLFGLFKSAKPESA